MTGLGFGALAKTEETEKWVNGSGMWVTPRFPTYPLTRLPVLGVAPGCRTLRDEPTNALAILS